MAAENSGANSYEQRLQDDEEHVMVFLHMSKEALNNQGLSELLESYCVNSFRAAEFCAALKQHVHNYRHEEGGASFECHPFATNFTSVYRQELQMRESLLQFQNNFVKELRRVGASKNVSSVFFTAFAAISLAISAAASAAAGHKMPVVAAMVVAAAASATSVVIAALGKWRHSFLKKNESAVHRHKDIIGSMITGSEFSTKDLGDIDVLLNHLSQEIVKVDVRERLETLNDKFQELGMKADAYSRYARWNRGFVLDRVQNTCNTIHS